MAPLVLVGTDALATGAVRALPRRPGVVVVATRELPAADWAGAVEIGAERVAVLPDDESWLLARSTAAVRSPVERGWLAVVGGSCGGAGASTVAAALALAGAPRGAPVRAGPRGAGVDPLLGGRRARRPPGAGRAEGWRGRALPGWRGGVGGDALLGALPEVGGVHVVAASGSPPGPVPVAAMTAVVDASRAVGCPVVIDLPRTAAADVPSVA